MQFQKSADTKILESVLSEAQIGQTVTYEELSKAIGRDVREFAFASLRSARRGVLRDHQIVFDVDRNVGLVRLDDAGIVGSTEHDRKRILRVSKRSLSKLACADFDKLDDSKKREHVVMSAQMGALSLFSTKSATRKIEGKVNGSQETVSIGETLRLFTG